MDVSVFRFDTAMFQPCGRTRITAVWRRHSASALSAGAASCRLPQLKMPPYSLAVDSIAPAACGRFRAVCPPSLELSSSFQQVPHTAFHPSGAASGGVLDPIFAIAVLPALLGGIPELEAQVLCTILQSPVDKLLGDGFDLLLQILCVGMLLLDLLDLYHLLSGEAEAVQGSGPIRSRRRHRLRRTGSHQLIESVLGEAVHKGNNGAATFDQPTPGVHIGDVGELIVGDI